MSSLHHEIIILGSGPAGLTAGLYAARAGFNPLIITGPTLGGSITRSTNITNWPGISHTTGIQLMTSLADHAQEYGARIVQEEVVSVDLATQPFTLSLESNRTFTCKALIIALGTIPRKIECPGEDIYWNRGIGHRIPPAIPASPDPLVIVGGGNSAITHALRLTTTHDVVIIHEGPHLTATDPRTHEVHTHPRIRIIYNATVTAIDGNGTQVTHITITNESGTKTLPTRQVIIAIGGRPHSELFTSQLLLTPQGHIITTPGTTETIIPGVFAAGDITNTPYRLALTSAAAGAMAALDAEKFLRGKIVVRF